MEKQWPTATAFERENKSHNLWCFSYFFLDKPRISQVFALSSLDNLGHALEGWILYHLAIAVFTPPIGFDLSKKTG
jgi:hypothetical protein